MIYIAPCIECGKRAVYNIEEQQMVCFVFPQSV